MKINKMLFTFQYGATSTSYTHILERYSKQFTFQYGATSTYMKMAIAEHGIDLHSNMELLLQKSIIHLIEL